MSDYQKQHHISRPPGLLEYLGYVLCLGNLLAGPFFEFSDYQQWIYSTGVSTQRSAE
jgi:lysophospholipid acyltransferase